MNYLISDPHLIKKDELKWYREKILFYQISGTLMPKKLPDINNEKKFKVLILNFVRLIIFKIIDRSIEV